MKQAIKAFKNSHLQTKFFILMSAIYLIALAWTTLQAYARIVYTKNEAPTIIHIPPNE